MLMFQRNPRRRHPTRPRSGHAGFTLIELIVASTILVILTGMILPTARVAVRREKERELKANLREIRDAIDRYKEAADRGAFNKADTNGYPDDLETLVKGVDFNGKKIRFLRAIPKDPMTGKAEWGKRSMDDDPDSDSWDGKSVWDVFTTSQDTALDGTRYRQW
jgi:general secretion pathway protein G